MKNWLLNHAALSYADQWYATDRKFIGRMLVKAVADEKVVHKLASKYMVARCFKKIEGLWPKVAAELDDVLAKPLTPIAMVDQLAARLGKVSPITANPGDLHSAASKFLWFSGERNVRIYDRRAVSALAKLDSEFRDRRNYGAFVAAWNRQFKCFKLEIQQSLDSLGGQLHWSIVPPEEHRLLTVVAGKRWFAERVFDKYLWTIGSAGDSGAGSFM